MAGILANSASKTMLVGDTAPSQTVSGFVAGEQIALSTTPTGTNYVWGESIPSTSGSSRSALSSSTGASVAFTPDVGGLYVVTCVVDSVTTYTLTISVVASQAVLVPGATQFIPVTNVAIPTPGAGRTLFYSSDLNALAVKDPTGATATVLGSTGGARILLTDQAAPAAPSTGTLYLQSFNQQGFSVPHVYDTQGDAVEITRDCITVVRNNSGGSLPKGTVVYVTGSTGAAPTVAKAQANSTATMPAVGIMYDTTANTSYGRMMIIGNLENFDLSAFTSGALLYVSDTVAGALTATVPALAQSIGTVLSNGAGNGVLQVFTRVVQRTTDTAFLTPIVSTTSSGSVASNTVETIGTLGAPITRTLPAAPAMGDWYRVNAGPSAASSNVTIALNGKNLNGSASNKVLNVAYQALHIVYNGTEWRTLT